MTNEESPKFTFEEVIERFKIDNDDDGAPLKENARYYCNPKDIARIGAVIMRLERRVEELERKLNNVKRRNKNTGYTEATLEYPNGKKKRKSNKGLAPGFKRPKEWAKPGQYKRGKKK